MALKNLESWIARSEKILVQTQNDDVFALHLELDSESDKNMATSSIEDELGMTESEPILVVDTPPAEETSNDLAKKLQDIQSTSWEEDIGPDYRKLDESIFENTPSWLDDEEVVVKNGSNVRKEDM